ncbi:glutamine synthetase family protein [Microbacterium sp. LWH3-1.2]|uniref:glutamine synthetase family protein n=1 Tax=Microbacterium sp. LWH3-1.2 TaxID=3135256 RepID=UPI003423AF39
MTHVPGDLVIGSIVDPGGVPRAKAVPASRAGVFATAGMGASPSWNTFCVDDQIAFTGRFSVVGDLRLRIDPAELRDLGGGTMWAPATLCAQSGEPDPACTRTALRRAVERLSALGLSALVGHELEFVLVDAAASSQWSAYGLGVLRAQQPFLDALLSRARIAGIQLAQVHAEYGEDQFEASLLPLDPVRAADELILARLVISQAARDVGLAASFSPLPAAAGAGNGAHQHLSLARDGSPRFSHGRGPHGLTDDGGHAIAGILDALPGLMAVLAGSVLSEARMKPGMWSGASRCWGLENREAAVRLCTATPGNPAGASIEIKPVDPSANPYSASAVLLEAARTGIVEGRTLPPETQVDPGAIGGIDRLPVGIPAQLELLRASPVAERALGPDILEAFVAVRTLEHQTFGDRELAEVCDRLRLAWSL